MKKNKIVTLLLILLLVAGCKDKSSSSKTSKEKENPIPEGATVIEKHEGNWEDVEVTISDDIYEIYMIGNVSISVPNWDSKVKDDISYYKSDKAIIAICLNSESCENDTQSGLKSLYKMSTYSTDSTSASAIGGYSLTVVKGSTTYDKKDVKYIAYNIQDVVISGYIICVNTSNLPEQEVENALNKMMESLKLNSYEEPEM